MASRYRAFLKICEQWPIDKTKTGRDLGAVIRQRVVEGFSQGEATTITNEAECQSMYDSLQRIVTNHSKTKYRRLQNSGCTGLSEEVLREAQSTELLEKYGQKSEL